MMGNSLEHATDDEVPPWDQPPAEAKERGQRPIREKSDWWITPKFLACCVVCLAVTAVILQHTSNYFFPPEVLADLRQPTASPRTPPADTVALASPPPRRSIATDRAVQRSKLIRAQADIQACQKLLDQVKEQEAKWEAVVPSLLSGVDELGRGIAADPTATRFLLGAIDRERLSVEEIDQLRGSLLALAVPVEAAVEDESATLQFSGEFTAELSAIMERLRGGLKRWQDDNALVRLLTKEAEDRPEGDLTLAEAIEELQAAEARRRAEKIEQEVAAAKAASVEREADSRADIHELESQIKVETDKREALRLKVKLAGIKAEQDILRDQLETQRKRADLERRYQADLPEIRRLLTPFTSPGHQQLIDGKWRRVEDKQAISLAGLRSINALGTDEASETMLYNVAGSDRNDRPNGPFRYHNGRRLRDSETPVAQRARRLLLEYGDLLVEEKLLMP